MTIVEKLTGVTWEALEEKQLAAFLGQAGDEGLTWEVKGGDEEGSWPRREQIEKAVGGFANSELGGVLIIGAKRRAKGKPGWDLNGLKPPKEEETELAIAKKIRGGVRPTPNFRVKAWPTSEGRKAAIVLVSPVDRPPAITRDGRVFERTSGATEPVRDPAMLARLFAAGERASGNAEAKAELAASRVLASAGSGELDIGDLFRWSDASSQQGRIGLGVAATSYEPDIGGRLHRRAFAETMEAQARGSLISLRGAGLPKQDTYFAAQRRERLQARIDPGYEVEHARRFFIAAQWDGSVGVASLGGEGDSLSLSEEELLVPSWNLACRLVLALGGSGRLHLVLHGTGPMHGAAHWPSAELPVRRWLELSGNEDPQTYEVAGPDFDYVMDELRRTAGEERWNDQA
jgi:hypothetical protein